MYTSGPRVHESCVLSRALCSIEQVDCSNTWLSLRGLIDLWEEGGWCAFLADSCAEKYNWRHCSVCTRANAPNHGNGTEAHDFLFTKTPTQLNGGPREASTSFDDLRRSRSEKLRICPREAVCFGGSAHASRLMVVDLQVHICSDNGRQNHVYEGHPTGLAVAAVGTHAFR